MSLMIPSVVCVWIAWFAAVFGVYRADAVTHLDWQMRSLVVITAAGLFGICGLLFGRWLLPTQSTTDATLKFVYPASMAVLIVNGSNAIVREPKYWFVLWNLDATGDDLQKLNPLPIPAASGDWIKPHERLGPMTVMSLPTVAKRVKAGDRILGYAAVSCPNCIATRAYWIYLKHGKSGWYSPLEAGKVPDYSILLNSLKEIKADPDSFMRDIPPSARIAIKDSLQ